MIIPVIGAILPGLISGVIGGGSVSTLSSSGSTSASSESLVNHGEFAVISESSSSFNSRRLKLFNRTFKNVLNLRKTLRRNRFLE